MSCQKRVLNLCAYRALSRFSSYVCSNQVLLDLTIVVDTES